jgi:hypothetical protein
MGGDVALKATIQDMRIFADGSVPGAGYRDIGYRQFWGGDVPAGSSLVLQRLAVVIDNTNHLQTYLTEAYPETLQLIDVTIEREGTGDICPLIVGPSKELLLERVKVSDPYLAELDLSAGYMEEVGCTVTFRDCELENVGMDVGDGQTWIMHGNTYVLTPGSYLYDNPDIGPWFNDATHFTAPWQVEPDLPHQIYGNVGLPEWRSGTAAAAGDVSILVT